jgi:hypothetical protein
LEGEREKGIEETGRKNKEVKVIPGVCETKPNTRLLVHVKRKNPYPGACLGEETEREYFGVCS